MNYLENPISSLFIFYHFHVSERRFHKMSYQLRGGTKSKLNSLNEERKRLQRKISEIGMDSSVCCECGGLCCRGNYNHFTFIDYIMRQFSENPIKEYGEIWKPHSLFSILCKPVLSLLGGVKPALLETPETKCPELTSTGCRFSPEDRPIRCVLWTCRKFRNSLSSDDLKSLGKLTSQLSSLACSTKKSYDRKWPLA